MLLFALVSSCASCGPKVSVVRTVPAKYKVLNKYSIGILPFTSSVPAGAASANEITDSLYESLRIKRFYSEIKPLSYPKGMGGREIRALSAADVVRSLSESSVDVAIRGNVFKYAVDSDQSKKSVEREVGTGRYKYEPYYEDGQRKVRRVEIMEKISEDVPVVEKLAEVGFEIDLLDMNQKGWTDHDRFYKKENYSAEGSSEIKQLPRDSAVLSGLTSDLIKEAVDKFVPHAVAEDRVLANCRGCKAGLTLAKKGNWAEAVVLWSQVASSDSGNHAVFYNIGVAKEAVKDYASALENYRKAVGLSDKSRYMRAVDRVEKIMEDEKVLAEQTRGGK